MFSTKTINHVQTSFITSENIIQSALLDPFCHSVLTIIALPVNFMLTTEYNCFACDILCLNKYTQMNNITTENSELWYKLAQNY
jgi:hypothetical protein